MALKLSRNFDRLDTMQKTWIIHQNALYISHESRVFEQLEVTAFDHPLVHLILGIHQRYPENAHRILRNKIHYQGEINEWTHDWVKTGAKRMVTISEKIPESLTPCLRRGDPFWTLVAFRP